MLSASIDGDPLTPYAPNLHTKIAVLHPIAVCTAVSARLSLFASIVSSLMLLGISSNSPMDSSFGALVDSLERAARALFLPTSKAVIALECIPLARTIAAHARVANDGAVKTPTRRTHASTSPRRARPTSRAHRCHDGAFAFELTSLSASRASAGT